MKLNGIIGKGTGKLGSSVFAISGGEQIVREYNPVVSNPNTDAQVAQRAKLKLMSQIAAALAPGLGFAKKGLVSARNQFVSKNIGLVTYADGKATVSLNNIHLTPSNIPFNELAVTSSANNISAALATAADSTIKRVAYFVYEQLDSGELKFVESKIISEAGQGRTFPTTFTVQQSAYVVYAYGIKDNSADATMRYENYEAEQAGSNVILDVISMFRTSDYTLTKSSAFLIEV